MPANSARRLELLWGFSICFLGLFLLAPFLLLLGLFFSFFFLLSDKFLFLSSTFLFSFSFLCSSWILFFLKYETIKTTLGGVEFIILYG